MNPATGGEQNGNPIGPAQIPGGVSGSNVGSQPKGWSPWVNSGGLAAGSGQKNSPQDNPPQQNTPQSNFTSAVLQKLQEQNELLANSGSPNTERPETHLLNNSLQGSGYPFGSGWGPNDSAPKGLGVDSSQPRTRGRLSPEVPSNTFGTSIRQVPSVTGLGLQPAASLQLPTVRSGNPPQAEANTQGGDTKDPYNVAYLQRLNLDGLRGGGSAESRFKRFASAANLGEKPPPILRSSQITLEQGQQPSDTHTTNSNVSSVGAFGSESVEATVNAGSLADSIDTKSEGDVEKRRSAGSARGRQVARRKRSAASRVGVANTVYMPSLSPHGGTTLGGQGVDTPTVTSSEIQGTGRQRSSLLVQGGEARAGYGPMSDVWEEPISEAWKQPESDAWQQGDPKTVAGQSPSDAPSRDVDVQQLKTQIDGAQQIGQRTRSTASNLGQGLASTGNKASRALKTAATASRTALVAGRAAVSAIGAALATPQGWFILLVIIVLILIIIIIIVVIIQSSQSNSIAATNEVARETVQATISSAAFSVLGPSIGRNIQVPLVANSDGVEKDSSDAVRKIYVRAFHQLSADSKIQDYKLTLRVSFPNSLNLLTPEGKVLDRNSSIMTFNVIGVSSFAVIGTDAVRWECSNACKSTDIEIIFTSPIDLASSGGQILLTLVASDLKDQQGVVLPTTQIRELCYDVTNVAGCTTATRYGSGSVSGGVSGQQNTGYTSDGVLQVCPMDVKINTGGIICTSGMKDKRGNKDHNAVDIASADNQGFLTQDVVSPVTGIIVAMSDPKSELRIGGRWYQIQDAQRPEYTYVIAHLQPNTEPQGRAFNKGTRIQAGQILGKPFYATSGYDRQYWSGPHVHFQVRRNGQAIDPAPAIREKCGWQNFRCPN
ncbi:MAG: hypothetical protein KatS3mg084_0601 [Candidatus Dojkabacteria bacterium]|nr:MAG: hypothetical protein KatS3mg084_0601 [Candidatus Dojkabacteria bacterium]